MVLSCSAMGETEDMKEANIGKKDLQSLES